ncbi:MAG: hypothetical protein MUE47_03105 [Acidobacteria bacterium]|nr:hypothetical protein [Acidobacteriota bacterium]
MAVAVLVLLARVGERGAVVAGVAVAVAVLIFLAGVGDGPSVIESRPGAPTTKSSLPSPLRSPVPAIAVPARSPAWVPASCVPGNPSLRSITPWWSVGGTPPGIM